MAGGGCLVQGFVADRRRLTRKGGEEEREPRRLEMDMQIFAYQAEAFLMLCRQEDAEELMIDGPKFETDASTKFFGGPRNAYQLSVRAQLMWLQEDSSAVFVAQLAALH
ncbi:hypothetical protein HPP92_010918 [Vanilla planifolia]|uniref:Uncharacterized protein n=1 Tax=Vanilla planifolia TaxID=51239 RepID=A0A835R1U5_VANPL|nr:hypothetical protein HPP92_010918 [Vanilla planifolia]